MDEVNKFYTNYFADVYPYNSGLHNNGQFRLMLPEGTVNVHILNVNGQVVMARKVDGDELLEMNTGLANGLYFVKSVREDGSFNTEKLIINR